MAKANSTRRKAGPGPSTKPPPIERVLADIRLRLAVAMAVVYVVSAALKAQDTDSDADAALVLQRSVGDELDRQIERLDTLGGPLWGAKAMSTFHRRSTDREPPPGTSIAEFANGHDALEFVKVCKDKTYTVTIGVNMPFAVHKAIPGEAHS